MRYNLLQDLGLVRSQGSLLPSIARAFAGRTYEDAITILHYIEIRNDYCYVLID